MPKPVHGDSRYLAGIDGLRAIAVLAVIAYHLNLSWAPGGLLGVGVFFVLSGYLITNLLTAEWQRDGRINFKAFWFRRARRLLPALFVMLAAVISWVTFFDPVEMAALRGDVLAAVLYVSNWWYIFHHVSYFARFGPPSPLTHLWSLAVEEQFYLVWPLALALGLWAFRRKGWLIAFTLAAALASAVAMALIYQPGADPSRVYYGTDTRAFGLLIGAALAIAWPGRRRGVTYSRQKTPWLLDLIGTLGLLGILLMIWRTNEYQSFLYRGGLALLAVASAATVAALAHPQSRLATLLGAKPLRWLGVRSYGIYLWHYPVIILTSPAVNTEGFNILRALAQVLVSILLAALSWHFIEEPIRQGVMGRLWDHLKSARQKGLKGVIPPSGWVGGLASLGMLSICIGGLSGLVQAAPVSIPVAVKRPGLSQGAQPSRTNTVPAPSKTPDPTSTSPAPNSISATPTPQATKPVEAGQGVTAIGDSVMVDAAPYLEKLLPGIYISAHIGRQLYQTPPVIAQLKADHELGSRVIIELGTNGPFTSQQLIALLKSLEPVRQIILVNARVPRPWQNVVNSTLASVAATFPHTTLVNWFQASANENGWFYPDGVHLNPVGAQVYARLIAKAVQPAPQ